MQPSFSFAVEAHAGAATIYFSGTLSPFAALRVIQECSRLPKSLRRIRVDARGIGAVEAGALDTLIVAFSVWESARGESPVPLTRPRAVRFSELSVHRLFVTRSLQYRARNNTPVVDSS